MKAHSSRRRQHRSPGVWCTGAIGSLVVAALVAAPAVAQMLPGQSGPGVGGRPSTGVLPPGADADLSPSAEKPDVAAQRAFKAGMKSLNKAREYANTAAGAQNPDKKSAALEKMGDAYQRALDQFTEALSNSGSMVEAWDSVGYIHLQLGSYAESVDDYNHTLALKPDLLEAVEHRGEAYLGVDRLDEAKAAYMDLFNHERVLAAQLMTAMQRWLANHRAAPNGMRAADVENFDRWLQERDVIAKQTAALP